MHTFPFRQKTHGDLESLTPEVLKHLQSQQLSVWQYCLSVISTMSTLLSYCLHLDSPQLQGAGSDSDSKPMTVCVAKALQLLTSVMELLSLVDDRCESKNEVSIVYPECAKICLRPCTTKHFCRINFSRVCICLGALRIYVQLCLSVCPNGEDWLHRQNNPHLSCRWSAVLLCVWLTV